MQIAFNSIHFIANGKISFFMAEQYSIVYINYHILFIHSSVDKHLGCFRDLGIVSSAAENIGVRVSF